MYQYRTTVSYRYKRCNNILKKTRLIQSGFDKKKALIPEALEPFKTILVKLDY